MTTERDARSRFGELLSRSDDEIALDLVASQSLKVSTRISTSTPISGGSTGWPVSFFLV